MRSRASAGVKSRQRLSFGDQALVKNLQDFVLEAAAFAGVQFKNLPFPGVQTGTDKKLERALRKFLQPADGGLQHRAVKFFRQRGRKFSAGSGSRNVARLSAKRFSAGARQVSRSEPIFRPEF